MDITTFNKLVDSTIAASQFLLQIKGSEYCGTPDRLSNFKRGAELTGTTPLQVALTYLSKHYDSLATYIRADAGGQAAPTSEPISGRLDDMLNYCILIKALIEEKKCSDPEAVIAAASCSAAGPEETASGVKANSSYATNVWGQGLDSSVKA